MEELIEWLKANNIKFNVLKDIVFVEGWGKAIYQDMSELKHVFRRDNDGRVVFNCIENPEFLLNDNVSYVIFKFGDRFYYQDIHSLKPDFHVLKHLGVAPRGNISCDFYSLGIHSGYELLNGSGALSDWVKKAKFLGYKGIGICDYNTMAGTLDLQREADKAGLRYVFGYSLTVEIGDAKVNCKVYACNERGKVNLLHIQKDINVDREDGLIDYSTLVDRADGNVLVIGKWHGTWMKENLDKVRALCDSFDGFVYFQVDVAEYRANRIDEKTLFSTRDYFETFYKPDTEYGWLYNVRPVLIQDMYYLDADDWKNKIVLNKIDIMAAHEQSYFQYMKTLDEMFTEFSAVMSDKYDAEEIFYDMCDSTVEIAESSDVKYDLTENYAPKYDMTDDERVRYGDTHTMFNSLLEEGFRRLVPAGQEETYRQRLEYERYIIESTDNIDYFLIVWDQVNWAKRNGILVGIGRGSAGGCLISYLIGITHIDPIKWGLIFERFLLPERAGLEPCDVTKMMASVKSREYVELELENGYTYKFDIDAELIVRRGDREEIVYADELIEGDDIVWDNRDLLFTLDEVKH